MIENVPKAEDLLSISLRLYFKAWGDLAQIVSEWQDVHGEIPPRPGADPNQYRLFWEWQEFLSDAQSDLQAAYTLIQQSQEIALKARIAAVSPYLLLKRIDRKPIDGQDTWDFTDFPTIDASELIRAHDIICGPTLSKGFRETFEQLRRNRNKLFHLGLMKEELDPSQLFEIMIQQYVEVYYGRRWLADRLHFGSMHRWASSGHSDVSDEALVLYQLNYLEDYLPPEQFDQLLTKPRAEVRFICHRCTSQSGLEDMSLSTSDVPTAYAVSDTEVHCVLCDEPSATRPSSCARTDCDGELLSAEADSDGACMVCGWTEQDVIDDARRRDEERTRRPTGFRSV